MVTAEAERAASWDSFLDVGSRQTVEVYRKIEWPNIKRALSKDFRIDLPEGLEPCWVSPGKAIYWQQQITRRPVQTGEDSLGRPIREMQDFPEGWALTGPLPANNASQIAHYLNKGLRLRHPDQVVVEAEDPVPPEALAETTPEDQFFCNRHGYDRKGFKTWKGYVSHCRYYHEPIEETMPAEVLARAATFTYYCQYHDKGYNNQGAATRHMRTELKRPGKPYHATVGEMRMALAEGADGNTDKQG